MGETGFIITNLPHKSLGGGAYAMRRFGDCEGHVFWRVHVLYKGYRIMRAYHADTKKPCALYCFRLDKNILIVRENLAGIKEEASRYADAAKEAKGELSVMKITFQRPDGSVETRTGRSFEAMVRSAFGAHAWLCAPEIGENAIGHVIDWTDGGIIAEVVGCSGTTAAKIGSVCMRRSTCLMLARMAKRNAEMHEQKMEAKKHAEAKE